MVGNREVWLGTASRRLIMMFPKRTYGGMVGHKERTASNYESAALEEPTQTKARRIDAQQGFSYQMKRIARHGANQIATSSNCPEEEKQCSR